MLDRNIPTQFFNMLPIPIMVVKDIPDTLNHPLVFGNDQFIEQIGWTLDDIPDKDTWWQKAYPDVNYQKVVARQWELVFESATQEDAGFVSLEVNIMTKHRGEQRFNVFTQIDTQWFPGFYIVAFEPLAKKEIKVF